MNTGSFKRLIGRLAVGALVLSGVSLSVAGPANAGQIPSVVGPTLVTQDDIRPNEDTYPGWHEGYANSSDAYFVGWDGVHLGIGTRSQIINGLVATGAPGLPVTGAALGDLITGSTISVESGEISMQVAITTADGWGTLRPAVLSSTSTQATLADMWVSSKTIGAEVTQETPMTLESLLAALDAQGDLRYSAHGFLAMATAVVSAMTWGSAAYDFGPSISAISDTSTHQVTGSQIRLDEASYPGWHEGYVNSSPAFSVAPDGLHIGDGANSQIINGLATPTMDADLRSLITSSRLKVVSGAVSLQIPLFYGPTEVNQPFTTIRPAALATPGTTGFALSDSWVSSKAIPATALTPAIAAEAPVALGDLIDALEAHTSVQLLGFGVLAMGVEPSVVASLAWNGVSYNFVPWKTKTTLSGQSTSFFGSDVTYTAKVSTISPSGGTPTGAVQFWSDATPLGDAVPLAYGSATFTVKDLPIGATTVTAKFQGSEPYLDSSARDSQMVSRAPTTVTVPIPDGTVVGSTVVLTATVGSGAGVPTGKVEFSADWGQVKSVDLVDGKATFTLTKVSVGMTRVFAKYLGSATHDGSWVDSDIAVAFPEATGTDNEIYITHVYRDLFGRNPDKAGLALWSAKLDGGTPRGAVANSITYSTEFRSALISDVYAAYLGRTPDPAGLKSWLGAMNRGLTIAQMESGFMASNEYYAASGDTDWDWVGQMYADVLGRYAATSEVKLWVQRLSNGSSRQQVSMGFLLSSEHLGAVVNGMYVGLLNRDLDPIGRANWVRILQAGGRDEAIIAGIVASEEYYWQG